MSVSRRRNSAPSAVSSDHFKIDVNRCERLADFVVQIGLILAALLFICSTRAHFARERTQAILDLARLVERCSAILPLSRKASLVRLRSVESRTMQRPPTISPDAECSVEQWASKKPDSPSP